MRDEQLLEKTILAKIDMLIEIIYSVELCGEEEKERYQKQGSALIKELAELLAQLIGPREEYINNAIKELIAQRMPEHNIESSFGVLNELCEIVNQDVSKHSKLDKCQGNDSIDPLQKAINYLFSQYNIIKKFRYHGCFFEYYIPALKVAVDNCTQGADADMVRKEYICRQAGIKYVSINCHELPCSREIIREIKRQLDINNSFVLK